MIILPKRANEITSEFSDNLYRKKKMLKYIWEHKDPWIAKVILIKKSATGNNRVPTSNSTEDLHSQYGSSTQRTHALKRGPRNKTTTFVAPD